MSKTLLFGFERPMFVNAPTVQQVNEIVEKALPIADIDLADYSRRLATLAFSEGWRECERFLVEHLRDAYDKENGPKT